MLAIDANSSKALSLTSQLLSCKRFKIIGPNFCISEPANVSTKSAKFGAKKCSTDNCANLSTSTANCNRKQIFYIRHYIFELLIRKTKNKINGVLLALDLGLPLRTA